MRSSKRQRPNTHPNTAVTSDDLLSLPDVGRATVTWLRAVGIDKVSALRKVGPVEAFGRVAFRFGSAVNRNLLYALAMGLQGRKYNSATEREKRELCDDAGLAFHPRPRRRKRR